MHDQYAPSNPRGHPVYYFGPADPPKGDDPPSIADATLRRSRSRSRKARLLREAVHNFCGLERPERRDIEVFKELFYQFIEGCEKSERRTLAASLSRSPFCPRTVLVYLAMDDYDVAAPILLFSAAINEADIVTLAGRLSMEHLKILCRRTDLTDAGLRALYNYGSDECHEILARNGAVKRRVDEFKEEAAASAGHADTTPKPQKEEKLTANEDTAGRQAGGTGKDRADVLRGQIVGMAARGGRLGRDNMPVNEPPADISLDRQQPLERQLVRAVKAGGIPALAKLVEQYCGIPSSVTVKLAGEAGLESFGVLFRGLGVGFVAVLQLILLVDRETGAGDATYDSAQALFARLDPQECRQFLEEIGARFDQPDPAADHPPDWNKVIASRRRAIAAERDVPPRRKTFGLRQTG